MTAANTQKTCGRECRLARRRRQGRQRRQKDLDAYRDDEAARQRDRRERLRAEVGCHAPALSANCWKSKPEISQIVAETFRRSRTGLARELRRMARKIRPLLEVEVARGGG